MIRAIAIDLRRSAALGAGLIVLLLGLAAMFLIFGQQAWSGRWSPFAATLRSAFGFTWSLTLAAGAWLVDRDRLGRVGELFAGTPRPVWQRVASPAVALSLTVGVAYLLTVAVCLPLVAGSATWFNPAVLGVIATGLPLLLAAGLLGMGVGTVVPSRFTAPALVVAGLIIASAPGLVSYHVSGRAQQFVTLLSPVLGQNGDFVIVPARLSLAQAVWAVALAATGFLLMAIRRAVAVVPAVAGAVTAMLLLPAGGSVYAADTGARELVCADGEPRVCVRRVHASILPGVVAPARDALRRLSRLPNPPSAVEEGIDVIDGVPDSPTASVATFVIRMGFAPEISADEVALQVLTGAGVTACGDTTEWEKADGARVAAAYWLLETPPPATGRRAVEAWQTLAALPAAEQVARVGALREAGLACDLDSLWGILVDGPR
ncbi:hypothetical protein [Actinoplanes couchii]|uniref:Uncharacterized protein n=1 Tax=Actinoplanes couchii TaxID=403638 RepID=A0ABQ3XTS0_9ACTN|nr:hypothetical protein [Actinoplanes couchii]MDR6319024.1 hypothetical protein [Actinoplanes couchii]GID61907.1 hypothetical protein Aco03nite_103110 [Actinoplanes couchii]